MDILDIMGIVVYGVSGSLLVMCWVLFTGKKPNSFELNFVELITSQQAFVKYTKP